MISQVKGVAEILNLDYTNKICKRVFPHYALPGRCYRGTQYFLSKESDSIVPPFPKVIITCGRRSIPIALAIRHISDHPICLIHIQKPDVPLSWFDWIVAPEHDHLEGSNVISTLGAVHHVTEKKLTEAAEAFGNHFQTLPRPFNAVMIGGSTNRYTLTEEYMQDLIVQLEQILQQTQGSLLITPSRRTGEKNIARLASIFSQHPRVYLYREGPNPYMAFLALADRFFVTNDSVSMISEACYTGKPVYVLPLKAHETSLMKHFVARLAEDGYAKLYENTLDESWTSKQLRDMNKIAVPIRETLKQKYHL